jgi:hypothetical protein
MPLIQIRQGIASPELEYYPPEGVPSIATVTIYTSGDAELTGTWPASITLDAATTTSTGNTVGDVDLKVASTTNFIRGRRYWVDDTDTGQGFEVKTRGVAGTTLYIDQPIPITVANGSPVRGHRLAYPLTTAQAAEKRRRLRAEWTYVVSGITYFETQFFDIVKSPLHLSLDESSIEQHDHTFGEYAGSYGGWRSLADGAFADLERMLRKRQIYPDLIRDRDGLQDALVYAFLAKFYLTTPGMIERSVHFAALRDQAIEDVMQARTWYDADDDLVVSEYGTGATTIVGADGITTVIPGGEGTSGSTGHGELSLPVPYARVG